MASLLLLVALLNPSQSSNVTCTGGRQDACPNNGICDPNSLMCVDSSMTVECGGNGEFLNCGRFGLVTGECGSGSSHDCYKDGQCSDKNEAYEAIGCNYPGLE